jgi:hypothetical protein
MWPRQRASPFPLLALASFTPLCFVEALLAWLDRCFWLFHLALFAHGPRDPIALFVHTWSPRTYRLDWGALCATPTAGRALWLALPQGVARRFAASVRGRPNQAHQQHWGISSTAGVTQTRATHPLLRQSLENDDMKPSCVPGCYRPQFRRPFPISLP